MPRKHQFTEKQMVDAIKQLEAGVDKITICRQFGVNERTLYKWRAKFGGMETSDLRRLHQLEEENERLKKLLGEAEMDKQVLRAALRKKY
jgi:putative transposase